MPVVARFSNGGGNPHVSDKAQDVRGFAVSFRLPDGSATDLLGQTAPRFPVRTPEDFFQLVEATSSPAKLPLFIARHPDSFRPLLANLKAKSVVSPYSYAEVPYFTIHAYKWIAPDGSETWVRSNLIPQASTRLGTEFSGKDRLQDELAARLEAGPVRFTLSVQVAGPADDPHDPMSVWGKESRQLDAGTIEISALGPDQEADGGVFVFDPTRIVDGIELSEDPILQFRAPAYSASISRRLPGSS